MGKVAFSIASKIPPDRVVAALLDFSNRRPQLWPAIDGRLYRVYSVGQTSAEVQEGTANPFVKGGVWVREAYDWSTPGLVRATTVDSNVFRAGSVWEMRVRPDGTGGSQIAVLYDRKAKNLQGRVIGVLITLIGRIGLPMYFRKTLTILQQEGAEKPVRPFPSP